MNEDKQQNGQVPNPSESVGSVPNTSESFGTVRNPSESFGTVPHPSEAHGKPLHFVERKANHTLTVREVARMFEAAGVARTERSITNWCQENRTGVARLDAYFDPNERKYFITPESVSMAIQEEQSKAARAGDQVPPVEPLPNRSEPAAKAEPPAGDNESGDLKGMRQEIMDLKITNRAKDMFIEQLQKEREGFVFERQGYVDKLMEFNRKVGQLETRLLALEAPKTQEQVGQEPSTGQTSPNSA